MRNRARSIRYWALSAVLSALLVAPALAQQPVRYRVSFPAPEHHYAQVEVTFTGVPAGTLEARMSRSSPGRYAVHEFSKNVFDLHAFDGKGKELKPSRPHPSQWNVSGHDGTVRIVYKVFGLHVDGTYLAVDDTHAHMNMPATLMWARGFDMRPARVTFEPPAGSKWKPATQLFPTEDAWTFTAPNLQYLMDSPTELSDYTLRSFKVRNPDGKEFTIHTAVHHDGDPSAIDEYAAGTEKIVNEAAAIFGEFPVFDNGSYTFLGDYVPWGGGDGMEHRNSTVVASPTSFKNPQTVRGALGTVSHEFFHAWNVERIRPKSLEPFNFEDANISGELWLAEGFTQYYGPLIMARAGLQTADPVRLVSSAHRRAQQPGAAVQVRGRDEPARAVHRRGRRDRRDEFFDDVHFVLHLRRGDRGGAGFEPARPVEREALARRLHARDVARARQARRPEPGPRREAVHAQGRARSAGRSVGRSPVRRRVLRQVHRGAGGSRLRPALRARRAGAAQAQRRSGVGRRARSGRRRRGPRGPSRRGAGGRRSPGGGQRRAGPRPRRIGARPRSRPGSTRGMSSRTPTGIRLRAFRTGRPPCAPTSRAIRCRSSSHATAPSSEA